MGGSVVDNRYELIEYLGGGGMAEVYRAHDSVLGRNVALKFMSRRHSDGSVELFEREARSAAALSHPNIVPVHDRGQTEDGAHYISMEYVPGGTLAERISGAGSLEPHVAAEVAIEIAEALEEAHEWGVIHRDVKPRNVLVTARGDVKVADFGIALSGDFSADGANSEILGTASYMSPEQASGAPVSAASDLYSLGVTLYEMLTGHTPARARTHSTSDGRTAGPPPLASDFDPDLPRQMDGLLSRLMAKDPGDRPASASELIDELHSLQDGMYPSQPANEEEAANGTEADDILATREGACTASGAVAPVSERELLAVPGRAAVLSLLIPGLGQVYNGQTVKGLCVMVIQLINLSLTGILIGWVPLVMVWVWTVRDARRTAERILVGGRSRWRLLPWAIAAVSVVTALLAVTGYNPL